MKKVFCLLLAPLLVGMVCWADGAPVAVRVEVQPVAAAETGTRVEVMIQVSPEDRGRLGRNAMVRIELDGGVPPGQSPLWAVRIEDDGSAVVKTVWPPGEHVLTVSIESSNRLHTGLWVGQVRVPDYGSAGVQSVVQPKPPEQPDPQPAPEPPELESESPQSETAATAAVVAAEVVDQTGDIEGRDEPVDMTIEVERPEVESAPSEDAEPLQPPAAGLPAAAAVVAASPSVETENQERPPAEAATAPVIDEAVADEPIEETQPPEVATVVAAGTAAALSASSDREEPTESQPDTAPVVEPKESLPALEGSVEPVAAAAVAAVPPDDSVVEEKMPVVEADSESIAEPVSAKAEDLVVQPLRGEEAVAEIAEPEPEAVVLSPDRVSAYGSWMEADDATKDLTIVVTRNREPVSGLEPEDLRLRLDKVDVPIARLGDRNHAPLLLGFAVDMSPAVAGSWSQTGRGLDPLLSRAGGGRGRFFVATTGESSDWDADPDRLTDALSVPMGGNLGRLIASSLARFEGQQGRSFLLVVTDGRSEVSKEDWQAATDAVEGTGVPLLVIALWDDLFSKKVRKQLSQLADESGGRLFLAQGADQLAAAVERYGPLLDAGVALRYLPPGGDRAHNVSISATDSGVQISAPRSTR